MTCDEKWLLYDNRERTGEWLDVGAKPGTFPKPDLHPKKVQLSVWWTSRKIIHYSILEQGEIINGKRYCKEIREMHKKLINDCFVLGTRKDIWLLHDNARPHVAKEVKKLLNELSIKPLEHPPYSPDISPSDYYLFKHLSRYMRNKVYKTKDEVENAFLTFIASREEGFFERGIKKLPFRWEEVIDAEGDYLE